MGADPVSFFIDQPIIKEEFKGGLESWGLHIRREEDEGGSFSCAGGIQKDSMAVEVYVAPREVRSLNHEQRDRVRKALGGEPQACIQIAPIKNTQPHSNALVIEVAQELRKNWNCVAYAYLEQALTIPELIKWYEKHRHLEF